MSEPEYDPVPDFLKESLKEALERKEAQRKQVSKLAEDMQEMYEKLDNMKN